ncbi:MAG TPA: fatty acid desaturase [Polyangiales bacterium]
MAPRELDKATWRRARGHRRTSWPTLGILALNAPLVAATVALAQCESLCLSACAVLTLLPWLLHCYLIQHECAHGAVFVNHRYNVALGHALGFLIFTPFLSRRHAHALHHAWTGHPEHDPTNARAIQRFSMLSPRSLAVLSALWRAWVPFLALGERIGLWRAPFLEPHAAQQRAIYLQLACYGILIACLYWLDCLVRSACIYATSLVLLWVVEELINLPHHLRAPLTRSRLPTWQQGGVTHSCAHVPIWSSWVLLNFNLHEAHHVWPSRPWHELRAAHRELQRASEPTVVSNELSWSLEQRRLPFTTVLHAYLVASLQTLRDE